jgi:trehalose/maltose hydrolase-like predicted phosphorylase
MGPDEFHEKYPESEHPGLTDNAYSNLMVVWLLTKALEILNILPSKEKRQLMDSLHISSEDIVKWKEVTKKLTVNMSEDGIIEQFKGYFNLKELDWEHYQSKYQDIHRMDRILRAEGLSPNSYKVSKQADVLMLFYNLSEEIIASLLTKLGYNSPDGLLSRNLYYYLQRTSHGSTLSRLVHAQLAAQVNDHDLSWKLYQESLQSDYLDIQNGTTKEGIHLGVMTGTVLFALTNYAGINWVSDQLSLNPNLPRSWKQMDFNLMFRKHKYIFQIFPHKVNIKLLGDKPASIFIRDKKVRLKTGVWSEVEL